MLECINPRLQLRERISELQKSYSKASPFKHLVIDNFLDEFTSNECRETFWNEKQKWNAYFNPIEIKLTNNTQNQWSPVIQNVFNKIFANKLFLQFLREVTLINNLEFDHLLHGGGLNSHGQGGKLDIHLDYAINPLTFKERKLNLVYYLNKNWDENYGGCLELRDKGGFTENNMNKISPIFNRLLIFETTNDSWHGMPTPLTCPKEISRDSMTCHYVCNPTKNTTQRYKAKFIKTSQTYNEEYDEWYDKLLCIRPHTIIHPQWQWTPHWDFSLPFCNLKN
jgi:Rps23 Pro-64 3,4-dihydroxylase Tpa1-like proline 4-hydroxylase